MTQDQLAHQLELAALDPQLDAPQLHALVAGAMEHELPAVCVTPVWVPRVAMMLRATPSVIVCTTVGFPHGTHKSTLKAIEATSSLKDGASEIAVVPHLPNLIKQDLDAARTELMEIVRAARATRRDVLVRVFVESTMLLRAGGEQSLEMACRAVRESGCDGVITATGYLTWRGHFSDPVGSVQIPNRVTEVTPPGEAIDVVRLLKKHGEGLTITAHGSIDDGATAIELLRAGADRVMSDQAIDMLESDAQV
jgi:deoxyribose-phosphate aldolase